MDMKYMQIFNFDNIVVMQLPVYYKFFTKEGGISYDEILSKNGRKIYKSNYRNVKKYIRYL